MKKIVTLALALLAVVAMAQPAPVAHSYNFERILTKASTPGYMVQSWGGCGNYQSFWYTPDAIRWTRDENTIISANEVVEIFGNTVLTAGINGSIASSPNAGATWIQEVLGKRNGIADPTLDFVQSSFGNANLGAFLGSNGDLWLKNGTKFTKVNSYSSQDYIDIDFNKSPNNNLVYGYAICLDGDYTIRRYNNSAWTILEDPVNGTELPFAPNAICGTPASNKLYSIIVGNNGQAARTTDQGYSWTQVNTPASGYQLTDVHFADTQHGYAIGYKTVNGLMTGIIIKTADNGATWTKVMEKPISQKWSNFRIAQRKTATNRSFDIYAWRTSRDCGLNGTDGTNITKFNYSGTETIDDLGLVYSEVVERYFVNNPNRAAIEENTSVEKMTVSQNYPNPFNPETSINFTLPTAQQVKVTVTNIQGQEIAVLANQQFSAGANQVKWNAVNQTSGLYFYKISTANESITKQMLLTK